jgi:6-phosphofructokinase 2
MNPTVDKSAAVDHVVAERKLRCNSPRFEPGGGGINVSRAIGKLGGESRAYYVSGGPLGDSLRQLLDQEGTTAHPISTEGWTRENLTVFEEDTQQQYRFGMPGPELTEKEWRRCLDELDEASPKPDFIVASGSLPPGVPEDFYARVASAARTLGARMILDTSGAPLARAVKEKGLFLIKPNLRELRALARDEIGDDARQEALIRELVESGRTEVVVLSLGRAGARWAWKKGCEYFRTPTVPIKSKVGAGDSMLGGITLALARGKTIEEAVRFGVAAGAAAVMTRGTELCRKEDADRLYAAIAPEECETTKGVG